MRREKKDQILAVLPEKIRGILLNHGLDFEKIQEIRLREEQPLAVKKEGKEELFTHWVTKEELRETMEYVSNYSLYAYENELRQGFLTIEGGHRVGIFSILHRSISESAMRLQVVRISCFLRSLKKEDFAIP